MKRSQFLKLILSTTGAALLAACQYALRRNLPAPTYTPATSPSQTTKPSSTVTPNATPSPSPSATSTPTSTATQTTTPTPTPTTVQVILLEPLDGAELPKVGRVSFRWQAFPATALYRFETVMPNGYLVEFTTPNTQIARYIESFPMAGEYDWRVAALDGSGMELARSADWHYTKPQSPAPAAPTDNAEDNGSGSDAEPTDDDGGPGSISSTGGTPGEG